MILKHNAAFKLRPYGKDTTVYQIQLHTTFNGNRLITSTGCMISDDTFWDEASQVVKTDYTGPKGETTLSINDTLHRCKEQMEMVFKYFEYNEINPTKDQVSEKYKERLRGITPAKTVENTKPKKEKKPSDELSFFEVFDLFTRECGEKNAWTEATLEKMAAMKADLFTFNNKLSFSALNEAGLTAFVRYLREDKVLKTPRHKKGDRTEYEHEDLVGLKNSTIAKKMEYLRWFLNWATTKGYNTNLTYKTFKPTLKATQKKVIFLTQNELDSLRKLQIPAGLSHLDAVRDVFLFCCFSGLRHSDVYNLRRDDIKDDHLEVTTVKTADSLIIELNSVTRGILEKYKDFPFSGNKALPVIQNQPMNRDLKELCRLAGVNERIRITSYTGNQRKDEVKEKWELVGTHTGRRTFIVNCLSLGIPPNVVMKWTGHSDYKAMKPYIDIVDSIKASEMTKLDTLL